MSKDESTNLDSMTLVGGGLVGSLLAIYLARKGIKVNLLERRPDMRKEAISAGRSINLAVSHRGLFALRELGLEKSVLELAIPMYGRVMHSVKGDLSFQRYGRDDSEYINSVSRGDLNKLLLTAAEETHLVDIKFDQKVVGHDIDSQILYVEDERTGQKGTLKVGRVIGTDGSASAIRSEMMKRPGYVCSQESLDYGYKEMTIPAGPAGSTGRAGGFQLEKNALHIWPRGHFMLIALPNSDGSFTATLFLPHHGPQSFEELPDADRITKFFEEQFPDVVSLLGDVAEVFLAHPTGHMVTVKCSPWNVTDKVLLLGDAAHAIVPFFGQGMNCGFEDGTILNSWLEAGSDWKKIFSEFGVSRKIHTDAIADMATENFVEMRDKVGNPRFLLQKNVERILLERFPDSYVSRYSLVTFSRVPYEVAHRAGALADTILSELCEGAKNLQEVDFGKAEKLISEKLTPYLNSQHLRPQPLNGRTSL